MNFNNLISSDNDGHVESFSSRDKRVWSILNLKLRSEKLISSSLSSSGERKKERERDNGDVEDSSTDSVWMVWLYSVSVSRQNRCIMGRQQRNENVSLFAFMNELTSDVLVIRIPSLSCWGGQSLQTSPPVRLGNSHQWTIQLLLPAHQSVCDPAQQLMGV